MHPGFYDGLHGITLKEEFNETPVLGATLVAKWGVKI